MTDNTTRVDAVWDTYREASVVSCPKLVPSGVRQQTGELESQPRYLCLREPKGAQGSPREPNGRNSWKIVKIRMSCFISSVRNYRSKQLILTSNVLQ